MITFDRLQQIIPADQALANKALSVALSQINGVSTVNLPAFAETVKNLETTKDLPLISLLQQAVPSSVANYYTSTLAGGTGNNDTILITDMLGTAIGWVSTDALGNTIATFSTMNLLSLTELYQTMLDTVNGVYGDPITGPVDIPTGPATGTYADANEAFEIGLLPATQSEIGNVISAYPAQVTSLNQDWNNMANQIILEQTLQISADLNYANLTVNQKNSLYGFIFDLPNLGLDNAEGGASQFIESLADLNSFTGQALIATLRQGRNIQVLSQCGIFTNTAVPADPNPPPPQANLLPSTYSESEAQNLVIK